MRHDDRQPPPRNTTGSLTLTLRRGDELVVRIPDSEPIVVYCADAQPGRVSLNIRAPRTYKIDRQTAEK
jgi:hypothetical protein